MSEHLKLDGFAHWYEIQAQEERDHAMMMRRYLIDNGIRVTFDKIAKPDKTFAKISDPLDAGYEHEKYVTSLINDMYLIGSTIGTHVGPNAIAVAFFAK